MMKHSLNRIISWGHELLGEIVAPGDLAVDLTAGRGQDSLALLRMVGSTGQVVAFDLQHAALVATQQRLQAAGAQVRWHESGAVPLPREAGVDLLSACHGTFAAAVPGRPTAVIANLGYLPGSDQQLITQPETTISALRQSVAKLADGGRLAVVAYPGHPGGAAEALSVADFFGALDPLVFDVLNLQLSNRQQAPALFVAEKKTGERSPRC